MFTLLHNYLKNYNHKFFFFLVVTSFCHMISITTIGITILLLLAYIVLVVGVAIGAFLGLLVDYVQKLLVKEHFMLKV